MRLTCFGFSQRGNENTYECFDHETGELITKVRFRDGDEQVKRVFLGWSSIFYVTENGNVIHSDNTLLENSLACVLDSKTKVVRGASGWNCTFVITEDGKCFQWKGCNYSVFPLPLSLPESLFVIDIATEDLHTVILGKDGSVYTLSSDKLEKLPFCPAVSQVCCGKEHVVLLTTDAKVFTYGLGSRGQLGHGTVESENKPKIVEALEGITIQKVAAGGWHSVAVSAIGDVYTWGWNESGQLGLLSSQTDEDQSKVVVIQAVPQLLDFPDDCIIKSVACGSRHTVAVSVEGEVWAWGWNEYNQLGCGIQVKNVIDHPIRIQLPNKPKVKDVICHYWSTVVIFGDNK